VGDLSLNQPSEELERERLKTLLESQHAFPSRYTFKVIFHSIDGMEAQICAVVAEATGLQLGPHEVSLRKSSGARFTSMTLDIEVQNAETVLDLYKTLGGLENVVSCF
tara:strand:+ start:8237 stop:8560 length:324 start_codon:yes stop_codon:yes gene_type:complete